jgi:colicin import membrane protein
MKTNYLKLSLGLAAILLSSLAAKAQSRTAYENTENRMYDAVHNGGGGRIERIRTDYEGKVYQIELVDEKMTELHVDGQKISQADWNKFSDGIDKIRQEIKEQRKRDAEQAIRNEQQVKRNAGQARVNEEQAKRNAEQDVRNKEQAKRNAEQAIQNEQQNKRNKEQVEHDQVQAQLNEEQAKRNAEQEMRNKEQSKRNAEQAIQNELQAKKNAEQARVNEKMMKEITEDLASDKIIPDINSLREMQLNREGMTINGVKQPDEVFKKYKAKYSHFFEGNFNYSRDGVRGN